MTASHSLSQTILVLGGTRSGKSRHAETLAAESGLTVHYIATAEAADEEMSQRIAVHRQRRPDSWSLHEEPVRLASCLRQQAAVERCLLVDCLALWLNNLLMLDDPDELQRQIEALLATLPRLPGQTILVGNESNLGITPLGALSRRYADLCGQLHQDIAHLADAVIFVVAGLPMRLK